MGSLPSVARLSSLYLTRGFASQSHDWFALVEKGGVFQTMKNNKDQWLPNCRRSFFFGPKNRVIWHSQKSPVLPSSISFSVAVCGWMSVVRSY